MRVFVGGQQQCGRLAGDTHQVPHHPFVRAKLPGSVGSVGPHEHKSLKGIGIHIRDGAGHRAWYSQRHLASGGDLYADVTTGYGPECFTIEGRATAYPYHIQAHYYSRGPMGYGMGKVEIIEHDGTGSLRFDQRPFVVMNDSAYVDLGTIPGRLAAK